MDIGTLDVVATPERIAETNRLGNEIAELSAHLEAAGAHLLDLIRDTTLVRLAPRAVARPGAAIYPSISTELQVAMSEVITGQQTPEAALDQAWHKLAR